MTRHRAIARERLPVERWRVLVPAGGPARGSFAWWLRRAADPHDLLAAKLAVLGLLLGAASLLE